MGRERLLGHRFKALYDACLLLEFGIVFGVSGMIRRVLQGYQGF